MASGNKRHKQSVKAYGPLVYMPKGVVFQDRSSCVCVCVSSVFYDSK